MSKEFIVSSTRHETRVAILEDDQVVEIYYQCEKEYTLAGSIHKGRVTRVLPGMQSAFVDIGLERDAFLYVSDFFEDNDEYDKIVSGVEEKVLRLEKGEPAATAMSAQPRSEEDETSTAPPAPREQTFREPRESREASAPSATATSASAPNRDRDGRGRGRRSRRRRTPGGLPDSKFYSPRDDKGEAKSEVTARPVSGERREPREARELREPREPRESSPALEEAGTARTENRDATDLMVLPGESLAKYSAGDPERTEPESRIEFTPDEAAEDSFEAAAPLEPHAESVVSPQENEPLASGPVHDFVAAQQEPEEPLAVAATDELELAEDVEPDEIEVAEDEEQESDALAEQPLDHATELSAEAEASEPAEAGVEGEGPEPARIPQSLTAALREQGPRIQHRVSRRTRRRGRGGERGERPERTEQNEIEEALTPVVAPELTAEVKAEPRSQGRAERPERVVPQITDLLRGGQEIIVQIAKEPLGQKGARITSHIALPGRFLVYMPTVDHVGVSRKIPSDDERLRLKRILQSNRTGIPGGYIVRTAGDGRTEEELRADMLFLYNLWMDMRQRAEKKPAPALLHHDLDVVQRILRDQLTSVFKTVWVDNEEVYESVLGFVQRFQPAMVNRIKLYTRPTPIFDEFGITQELEKALKPKVWLKSGGSIVINQTEALVAIDINTGKYVGKSNRLEDTIVKINTDAIKEIVRQIRLRDLGGIIVVDFIDMDERKNRQKVMQALEEAMRVDRAPYKILQFNDFGLVAITRKRVKQSLERTLCSPCPYCEGAGSIKSVPTVIGEILVEAQKVAKVVEGRDVMLRVNPEVAKVLKSNQNDHLQELEEILGRTVIVKTDPLLHVTRFDLA